MTSDTVTLGGRRFAVEPLKLGELRALLDAIDDLSGKTGGAMIDAAARVVHAGLARSTPELSLDNVLDTAASLDEVTRAVETILRVAGLTRVGEMPPVAMPGAGRAPSSRKSTERSPPAADTPLPSSTP